MHMIFMLYALFMQTVKALYFTKTHNIIDFMSIKNGI